MISGPSTSKSGKKNPKDDRKFHTIDSDEEEEYNEGVKKENDKNRLDTENDVEGCEDSTIDRDGDIQITPFNLKNESSDGYFGKDGGFVWKRKRRRNGNGESDDDEDDEEVTDPWLDNINWGTVKPPELPSKGQQDEKLSTSTIQHYNEIECYKSILDVLKPKESIASAIRRLGQAVERGKMGLSCIENSIEEENAPTKKKSMPTKRLTTAQKWKLKKEAVNKPLDEDLDKYQKAFTTLSENANKILTESDNMSIYDETFESITFKVNAAARLCSQTSSFVSSNGDNGHAKSKSNGGDQSSNGTTQSVEDTSDLIKDLEDDDEDEVMWEYKTSDDGPVKGPHSTSQMMKFVENGKTDCGDDFTVVDGGFCQVRKVTSSDVSSSTFYNLSRIDFDLYT